MVTMFDTHWHTPSRPAGAHLKDIAVAQVRQQQQLPHRALPLLGALAGQPHTLEHEPLAGHLREVSCNALAWERPWPFAVWVGQPTQNPVARTDGGAVPGPTLCCTMWAVPKAPLPICRMVA